MKQSIYIISLIASIVFYSCTDKEPMESDISKEIEEGNFASLIFNQDWSANYIVNYETETVYEGYFIFHFNDDGYFFIDAYDKTGVEVDYPIFGGQYSYVPGNNTIYVDFRKVGQSNPFWPKTDNWYFTETDATLDGMPNPYQIVILANNPRLMTDLYPGNILKFKNIRK